ncbi:ATP-binding protein [Nocardia sp. NBC_00511]|uniref:sensor histidine kinase n=1 Tax=Nocardia sp. NBC_00511 TaxID=2903591 RepID=UPI0030DFB028
MLSLGPRSVRLRTQIVLLQIAVVGLTVGLAFGVFAYVSGERLSGEYGQRALAIARAVASDPQLRADVTRYADDPRLAAPGTRQELAAGTVERFAEATRIRTDALFVVITDDAGIRLAHPDPARLGEMVSTDPSRALAGAEVVIQEHGTLGESVRAKVPVLEPNTLELGGSAQPSATPSPSAAQEIPPGAPTSGVSGTGVGPGPTPSPGALSRGRVVGEVSVGISTAAVHDQLLRDLRRAGLLIGGALLAGIVGSVLLARRWHGLTLGLEPSELAELVREQDAVLHGIGEGVVAADTAGRITVVNDEARRLLGIDPEPGVPADGIGLTPRVLQAFRDADGHPVQAAVGERIVVVTARTVTRDGRPLGAVLSVRDRTDVESLTRQLDAVSTMSTVLRAQRHEFANRLHLLSGLLHTGRPDEAATYLGELLGSGPLGAALPGIDTVADPYLQAFLAAKAAHAREQGVELRLGPNTWVDANLAAPVDVTTVLGNLIDNAIDAAKTPAALRSSPAEAEVSPVVEVELVREGETLHIVVADSGPGVSPDLVDSLFAEGFSTKEGGGPGGRGVGLALTRQVARANGGEVWLADPGGEEGEPSGENRLGGAEFMAWMPGVLMEEEPAWAEES